MPDNATNAPSIKGGCTNPIRIRLRTLTVINGIQDLFLLTLHLKVTLSHFWNAGGKGDGMGNSLFIWQI